MDRERFKINLSGTARINPRLMFETGIFVMQIPVYRKDELNIPTILAEKL